VKYLRVFSRLALTIVLLVLAITLVNMVAASQISSYILRKEARSSNVVFLNKLSKLVEKELAVVDGIIVQYSEDYIQSSNITHELNDSYQKYTLYKSVKEKLFRNYDFIDSVYFYFDQGRRVYYIDAKHMASDIRPAGTFFDRQVYYDFLKGGSVSRMIGARELRPNYFDREADNSEVSRVFSFIKGIPMISPDTKDAMVVNVNEQYLLKLVSSNYMPLGSVILAVDKSGSAVFTYYQSENKAVRLKNTDLELINGLLKHKGRILTYSGREIGGESCYLTLLKMEDSDRAYVFIIPERELFKPITTVNLTIFIFSVIILILGIIISLFIDKKFFQPVLGILQILKNKSVDREAESSNRDVKSGRKEKKDEFKQIEGYIENILSKNLDQEKRLQNYFAYYKEKVLLTLLNGDEEAVKMLNEDKIIFNNEYKLFNILLVNFRKRDISSGEEGFAVYAGAFLQELVTELSRYGKVDKIQINRQKYVFLLSMEQDASAQLLRESVKALVKDRMNEPYIYTICIGNICDSMQKITDSYKEAEKILQCHYEAEKTGVYGIDDIPVTAERTDADYKTANVELVEKVIKYINARYMEDIGLNSIADYVYLSPSYLGKIFKEISGYTFTDYLIKVRMEAAADLLINKNININGIVSKVGYYSAQSFSRLFKNYYNCSPSEYRRKYSKVFLDGA
jgi:YesN/AraC family two-component response regulator